MSGAGALAPPLTTIRKLREAAQALGGPWGAVLELCILTLCLPWEAVAIEIERIDWERGFVLVPVRGASAVRTLALSHEAQRAILRIAGNTRGTGQAVTAGRGDRLIASNVRLDRLLDRLAVAAPETIAIGEWNFHGIRATAETEMAKAGADVIEIAAVIGRQPPNAIRDLHRRGKVPMIERHAPAGGRPGRRVELRGDVDVARTGAERWSTLLLATNESRRADKR